LCHVNLSKELRGGEMQMLALMEAYGDRFDQSVIVRGKSLLHARLIRNGVESRRIRPVANSVLAAMRAAGKVDLIHVHEGRSVQVGAVRSVLGTPFIATRRVLNLPGPHAPTRWCYGRASAIVGVSEAVSVRMRDYCGAARIQTIIDCTPKLPVDTAEAQAIRDRYPGKLIVGHVGELDDRHKGQGIILDAARLAGRRLPQLQFLLVGSGRDEMALRAAARKMVNVEFFGRVDNVGDYYSAMDVFVFPSREEALGSAILEAMSCGVPVIGSNVGGIPEVVKPGENGFLFDSGDAEALFDRIAALAEDAPLRERLAAGARAMAHGRRVEVVAEEYAAVYRRVLGG
jgi:glycosyltransferase involved in cell wall biosynthesis